MEEDRDEDNKFEVGGNGNLGFHGVMSYCIYSYFFPCNISATYQSTILLSKY